MAVNQRTVMGVPVVARVHLSPQGDTRGSNAPLLVVVGAAAAVVLAAAGGGAGAVAVAAAAAAGVVLVVGGGGDGVATVTVAFLVGAGVGLGPPLASTATAARMHSVNATRHTCIRTVKHVDQHISKVRHAHQHRPANTLTRPAAGSTRATSSGHTLRHDRIAAVCQVRIRSHQI